MRSLMILGAMLVGTAAYGDPPKDRPRPTSLEAAEGRIKDLEVTVARLVKEVEKFQRDRSYELKRENAYFDYRKPGSAFVLTDVGTVVVRLHAVEPYVDGFRIHLKLANITCVPFSGIRLSVSFGEGREFESTFTNEVVPGTWSAISFVLAPATASDLESFTVRPNPTQVRLPVP